MSNKAPKDATAEALAIRPPALQSDVTYYVATTGSDATGDGSQGSPFATINYALSLVPKNLNGYRAAVNVAAGTYNEAVVISGFYGGVVNNGIQLTGAGADSTRITGGMWISANAAHIWVRHFTVSGNAAGYNIAALCCRSVVLSFINMADTAASGGLWIQYSHSSLVGCSISNKTTGILVDGSVVFGASISGSSNTTCIAVGSTGSASGGFFSGRAITISGVTKYAKYAALVAEEGVVV